MSTLTVARIPRVAFVLVAILLPYVWFSVVNSEAGKTRAEGECYTYVTLPIFVEGEYTVENLNPVPAKEHFELTGSILRQLDDLPDGADVDIEVKH